MARSAQMRGASKIKTRKNYITTNQIRRKKNWTTKKRIERNKSKPKVSWDGLEFRHYLEIVVVLIFMLIIISTILIFVLCLWRIKKNRSKPFLSRKKRIQQYYCGIVLLLIFTLFLIFFYLLPRPIKKNNRNQSYRPDRPQQDRNQIYRPDPPLRSKQKVSTRKRIKNQTLKKTKKIRITVCTKKRGQCAPSFNICVVLFSNSFN